MCSLISFTDNLLVASVKLDFYMVCMAATNSFEKYDRFDDCPEDLPI